MGWAQEGRTVKRRFGVYECERCHQPFQWGHVLPFGRIGRDGSVTRGEVVVTPRLCEACKADKPWRAKFPKMATLP